MFDKNVAQVGQVKVASIARDKAISCGVPADVLVPRFFGELRAELRFERNWKKHETHWLSFAAHQLVDGAATGKRRVGSAAGEQNEYCNERKAHLHSLARELRGGVAVRLERSVSALAVQEA